MLVPPCPFPPSSLQAHVLAAEAEKKATDVARQAQLAQQRQPGEPAASADQPSLPDANVTAESVADIRMPKFIKWQKVSLTVRQKTAVVVRQGMSALSSPDLVCKL